MVAVHGCDAVAHDHLSVVVESVPSLDGPLVDVLDDQADTRRGVVRDGTPNGLAIPLYADRELQGLPHAEVQRRALLHLLHHGSEVILHPVDAPHEVASLELLRGGILRVRLHHGGGVALHAADVDGLDAGGVQREAQGNFRTLPLDSYPVARNRWQAYLGLLWLPYLLLLLSWVVLGRD